MTDGWESGLRGPTPAVFLPGFCSLISLFSAMLFFLVITLLSCKQCVGREQQEHCGLW